jgi:hypothetical protein
MMRARQKQFRHLYPRWSKKDSPAKLAKERDGKRCVRCGVPDRTITQNAAGEPYMLYLHAAHLNPLDPDYQTVAPIQGQHLRAMCPRCHRCYDLFWQHQAIEQAAEVEHQRTLHGILLDRRFSGFYMNRFTQVI